MVGWLLDYVTLIKGCNPGDLLMATYDAAVKSGPETFTLPYTQRCRKEKNMYTVILWLLLCFCHVFLQDRQCPLHYLFTTSPLVKSKCYGAQKYCGYMCTDINLSLKIIYLNYSSRQWPSQMSKRVRNHHRPWNTKTPNLFKIQWTAFQNKRQPSWRA